MALSLTQKRQAFIAVQNACPTLTDAEFLRATIAIGTAWTGATDATVAANAVITEVNNFRTANPTDYRPVILGNTHYQAFWNAQEAARLN